MIAAITALIETDVASWLATAHFKGQLNAIHVANRKAIAMLVSMLHVAVDDEI